MAFHVACPITCRRICDCELGFPDGLRGGDSTEKAGFLAEVARVEEFLRDPWAVRALGPDEGNAVAAAATVQVLVPRVVPQPPPFLLADDIGRGGGDGEETPAAVSRRNVMKRQAKAAEDYVRMLEAAGQVAEAHGEMANNLVGDDKGSSISKVMCRICFSGESEGSVRAIKMVSCKMCFKKYHRSCLKVWGEYRDLFHWSSWSCPSCRICEVCRRAGDPNKLVFCKRCDAACHCYCQQPPHKNVTRGPYLCTKHTKCHSCGSTVPGNGLSTRWFLGHTCCDACGRLFVKGNYCPVCLKVYRDSESTPMVCCDVCQQWVHCQCDGISDEKYQQFQADGNLHYKCTACRGDCYQVKDIDDAVRELWRRRDKTERGLIDSLRAAAGLPSHEFFSVSPYSDGEDTGPVILRSDHGKSLKFSVKGLTDKSIKHTKEHVKNAFKISFSNKKSSKKGSHVQLIREQEEATLNGDNQQLESESSPFSGEKVDAVKLHEISVPDISSSYGIRNPGNDALKSYVSQLGSNNFSSVKNASANANQVSKIHVKSSGIQSLHVKEDNGKITNKGEAGKGKKLVIHIGVKNRNAVSPKSGSIGYQKEQDTAVSDGVIPSSTSRRLRNSVHKDGDNNVIKHGKASEFQHKMRVGIDQQTDLASVNPGTGMPLQHCLEGIDEPTMDDSLTRKQSPGDVRDASQLQQISKPSDSRPLLKLKFKNLYSAWASQGAEDKTKGQRSKRKRPSMEKPGASEDDGRHAQHHLEDPVDEFVDAKILQKLGKDAIGKRVEVLQPSDSTWYKGVVQSVSSRSSSISVHLDDGRTKSVELGKHGVRFVSQKEKRSRG